MAKKQQYTTQQIIQALKKNRGLVYLAAESIDCDPCTIFRRAKKIKKIRDVMKFYRQRRVDRAELVLDDRIIAGEPWAVQFTLKTLGKKRGYTEKQEIEHSGEQTINLILKKAKYENEENNDKDGDQ